MSKGPTQKIKNRLNRVVIALILLGFTAVLVNLFYESVIKSDFYQTKALENQMRDITVTGKRGTIYDRNMKAIARSATVWTVFISPNDLNAIKDETERENQRALIAENLSTILEVEKDSIIEKSKKKNYYEVIKKKVEEPEVDETAPLPRSLISPVSFGGGQQTVLPYNEWRHRLSGSRAPTTRDCMESRQNMTNI